MAFPGSPVDKQFHKGYRYRGAIGAWEKFNIDATYPVGSYYTQYPAAESNDVASAFPSSESPASLFGGTWEERFSGEATFFRTGGNDSGRSNGLQDSANKSHDHTVRATANKSHSGRYANNLTGTGRVGPGTTANYASYPDGWGSGYIAAAATTSEASTSTFSSESRPINRVIKIWRRTA